MSNREIKTIKSVKKSNRNDLDYYSPYCSHAPIDLDNPNRETHDILSINKNDKNYKKNLIKYSGITLLGLAICVGGIFPLKFISNNNELLRYAAHLAGFGKRTISDLYGLIATTMATSGLLGFISSRKGYLTAKAMKEEKEKTKSMNEEKIEEDSENNTMKSNNISAAMEAMNTQNIEFMRVANVPKIDFDMIRRENNEPEKPYFDNPLVEIPKIINEGKVR